MFFISVPREELSSQACDFEVQELDWTGLFHVGMYRRFLNQMLLQTSCTPVWNWIDNENVCLIFQVSQQVK